MPNIPLGSRFVFFYKVLDFIVKRQGNILVPKLALTVQLSNVKADFTLNLKL